MDVLSYLNSRSIKPRDIAGLRFKRKRGRLRFASSRFAYPFALVILTFFWHVTNMKILVGTKVV